MSPTIQISIIVPVFDVENYLAECLQSIMRQQFEHRYEVILIDDFSTDGSLAVCRQFEQENPDCIRLLINDENRGVSITRNRGLEVATGDYFMFVDPDDLLPDNALSHLYSAARQNQATIVKGNNSIFNDAGEKPAAYNVAARKVVRGDEILSTLYHHRYVRGHPWGKLFQRQTLGHLRFPVGVRMAQDLVFCSEAFAQASVLVLIDHEVYRYRLRPEGSTGGKFVRRSYLDWFESVASAGKHARTTGQHKAYKSLQMRTLAQLSRESRKVSAEHRSLVLEHLQNYIKLWNISLISLLKQSPFDIKTILRFLKMKQAINSMERMTSDSARHNSLSNR